MAEKPVKDAYTLLKDAYAKAERMAGDGTEISGTGATVLKQRLSPVTHLSLPKHDRPALISVVEQSAANDILQAIMAMTAPLRIKSVQTEYIDGRGYSPGYGAGRRADTVKRYVAWADFWTKRRNLYGDPMLSVIFAGVVDEIPLKTIGDNIGLRYVVVRDGFIAGLRDYAARAGWTTRTQAIVWKSSALKAFAKKVVLTK